MGITRIHNTDVVFVYLDEHLVPSNIAGIVGNTTFGQIQHGGISIRDLIEHEAVATGIDHFLHISSDSDVNQRGFFGLYPANATYIFMTGCASVGVSSSFRKLIKKLVLSNEDAIVGEYELPLMLAVVGREAAAELYARFVDRAKLSFAYSPSTARVPIDSQSPALIDLSSTSVFLKYFSSGFDTRHFNSIESDSYVVTKKSTDGSKIKREYDFYYFLPNDIQRWFVQPFSFEGKGGSGQYSMERYNFPDAALLWTHNAYSTDEFDQFLERIFRFLQERHTLPVDVDKYEATRDELYFKKVVDRLEALESWEGYSRLNEILGGSIRALFERYKELYARCNPKWGHKILTITHGDLCFSNVLYDKSSMTVKLIDPRGASSKDQIWSDPYYDLAKLSHSILGQYDFVVKKLYRIEIGRNNQSQVKFLAADLTEKQKLFSRRVTELGAEMEVVRLYEASLFLSMLPLHINEPRNLVAFAEIAGSILNEVEDHA